MLQLLTYYSLTKTYAIMVKCAQSVLQKKSAFVEKFKGIGGELYGDCVVLRGKYG